MKQIWFWADETEKIGPRPKAFRMGLVSGAYSHRSVPNSFFFLKRQSVHSYPSLGYDLNDVSCSVTKFVCCQSQKKRKRCFLGHTSVVRWRRNKGSDMSAPDCIKKKEFRLRKTKNKKGRKDAYKLHREEKRRKGFFHLPCNDPLPPRASTLHACIPSCTVSTRHDRGGINGCAHSHVPRENHRPRYRPLRPGTRPEG